MSVATVSTSTSITHTASGGWVRRHPLLAMYVLMFGLAWAVLVPQALASHGWLPFQLPMAVSLLAGWSPAIAALVITGRVDGRSGVRRLLGRFMVFRIGLPWYLAALGLLAAVILGGIGLHVLAGGAVPVIPALRFPLSTVLFAFVVSLVLGVLFNTEEVAWRGFALPRLQARHSALAAALLVALPEALFHLPYFWNNDVAFYQNVGLIAFTVFSIALSILYAWMFNNTRGSLVLVSLLHASQNTWANLLSDNATRPFYFTVALLAVLALVIVAVFGPASLSRRAEAAQ